MTGQGAAEPHGRVQLPGNLPLEPGKQILLLFPTCCCTGQIFVLESAALPRALQPRPALAPRLLAGTDPALTKALGCREQPARAAFGACSLPACTLLRAAGAATAVGSAGSDEGIPLPGEKSAGTGRGEGGTPAVGQARGARGSLMSTPGSQPPRILGDRLGVHLQREKP